MSEATGQLLEIALMGIAIPWLIWVTVSIFNQRQEIAILKEILKNLLEKSKEA